MPSGIAVDIARLWAPGNLRKVAAGTAVCAAIDHADVYAHQLSVNTNNITF